MSGDSTDRMASRGLFPVAACLFFSGLCSLVYQTTWLREFRLVFGASTPASAAVLAIFMGGIGAGSLWAEGKFPTEMERRTTGQSGRDGGCGSGTGGGSRNVQPWRPPIGGRTIRACSHGGFLLESASGEQTNLTSMNLDGRPVAPRLTELASTGKGLSPLFIGRIIILILFRMHLL